MSNSHDHSTEDMTAEGFINIAEILESFKNTKKTMSYIRPEMLPDIDLYMDQVTTFMDTHLQSTRRFSEDKILTKTMINNYAKNNLLPPPEKKKYSKDHLLLLIFIYYMKNMLSMNDIQSILTPVKDQFFHNEDEPFHLDDIYKEIFETEKGIQDSIIEDILKKYDVSRQSFADAQSEHSDMLSNFTFICMLCYDIFLKKQLVEKIVDEMNALSDSQSSSKKKR